MKSQYGKKVNFWIKKALKNLDKRLTLIDSDSNAKIRQGTNTSTLSSLNLDIRSTLDQTVHCVLKKIEPLLNKRYKAGHRLLIQQKEKWPMRDHQQTPCIQILDQI